VPGLHQGRARPARRGHRAQHEGAALPPRRGQLPPDHHPATRHRPAVRHHLGLRRHHLHRRRLARPAAAVTVGATRTGGIDLNKPRIRAALSAALALAAAPHGFTVAEFTAKTRTTTGQAEYTIRQGAYDLRKLRGKGLAVKPGRSRRYNIPPEAARTIAGLLTLRDQVIAPILAGVRSPRHGRKPAHWTMVDRDYENLRIGMQALFGNLGITTPAA
jgi:hypothetical protein